MGACPFHATYIPYYPRSLNKSPLTPFKTFSLAPFPRPGYHVQITNEAVLCCGYPNGNLDISSEMQMNHILIMYAGIYMYVPYVKQKNPALFMLDFWVFCSFSYMLSLFLLSGFPLLAAVTSQYYVLAPEVCGQQRLRKGGGQARTALSEVFCKLECHFVLL